MTAYLVLDYAVRTRRGLGAYAARIPAVIERHGGRYIVRGAEPTVVEGDWAPEAMVILEFPARANAEAFLGDPEAQRLFAVRQRTTVSKLVLVDGCTKGWPLEIDTQGDEGVEGGRAAAVLEGGAGGGEQPGGRLQGEDSAEAQAGGGVAVVGVAALAVSLDP